jgi:Fic-DOC domain mobile mystery protein B
MGLNNLTYGHGQTPLDEDEKEGLLSKTISTRHELDEVEQLNIQEAVEWSLKKNFAIHRILDPLFARELHKRMFRDVWRWAGEFRKTDKNIGVDKFQVSIALQNLLDDCRLRINDNSFAPDETAIRFKHRLVSIHCFPNGNGRHSRLMADIMISDIFKKNVFLWGANNLQQEGLAREKYLEALRAADQGDYESLVVFSRM